MTPNVTLFSKRGNSYVCNNTTRLLAILHASVGLKQNEYKKTPWHFGHRTYSLALAGQLLIGKRFK